jgi:hypothetical protein
MKTVKSPSASTHQPCPEGECIAGRIGSKTVKVCDWRLEVLKFNAKIELWDELTKHFAIPHMGWVSKAAFCGNCGSPVDPGFTPGDIPELPMTEDLKLILSLSPQQIKEQATALRSAGRVIQEDDAAEQSYVLHLLLQYYFMYGRDWKAKANWYIGDNTTPTPQ